MKKKIIALVLVLILAVTMWAITDPEGTVEAGFRHLLRIPLKEQQISLSSEFLESATNKLTMWYTDSTTIQVDGAKGAVTFTSQDEDVVTVNQEGHVKAIAPGNTWITVHAAATKLYKAKDIGVEVEIIADFIEEENAYKFGDGDREYYTLMPNAQGYYNLRTTGSLESMARISDFITDEIVWDTNGIAWFGMDDYVWLEEGKAYKLEFGSMEAVDYGSTATDTFTISCEGPEIVENGLFNSPSHGTWVYMTDGQPDYEFKGLVENEGNWWYVQDGTIDYTFTGIASRDSSTWYVTNGKVATSYSGYVTIDGTTYHIKAGQVVK